MASDTHQWNIEITGETPPPPPPGELPWIWIAGGAIVIGIAGILIWRSKNENPK